jgi:hypothetical protein
MAEWRGTDAVDRSIDPKGSYLGLRNPSLAGLNPALPGYNPAIYADASFDDTFYGNGGGDTLQGYGGFDELHGGLGDDWIYGNANTPAREQANDIGDFLYGEEGDDHLFGQGGSDWLFGGSGNDWLYGYDDFAEPGQPADLGDYLYGDDGNDQLFGQGGDDWLNPGSGTNQVADGGDGVDTVSYNGSGPVEINLLNGTVRSGASTDTVLNIENVEGSQYADIITGNTVSNVVWGFGGNDRLYGDAGADTAVFFGPRDKYQIYQLADGSIKVVDTRTQAEIDNDPDLYHNRNSDGRDIVSGFEFLRFKNNITIDLTIPGSFDDYADTISGSTAPIGTVPVNGSRVGVLGQSGDHDLFKVELIGGMQYRFTLTRGNVLDPISDPLLGLLDGTGDPITSNDDVDGTLDSRIIFTAPTTGSYYLDAGAYAFSTQHTGIYTLAAGTMGTTDFTGEGRSDILWRNTSTGQVVQYQMNGTAVTNSAAVATVGLQWQIEGTGDFNGDGRDDILWRNTSTGQVAEYQMNGTAVTNSAVVATVGLQWQIEGTGDFNGDGRDDILWRNTSTGQVAEYQMNGMAVTNSAAVATVGLDWDLFL